MTTLPSQLNADERTELLEAVDRVIADHGMDGIEFERVVEAVDGTGPEVSGLFEGPDELLEAAFADTYEKLADALADIEEEYADRRPMEGLVALNRGFREVAVGRPDLYEAAFRRYGAYAPASVESKRDLRAYEILLSAVEACAIEGIFGDVAPENVAETVWNFGQSVAGYAISGIFGDDEADEEFERLIGQLTVSE